MKKADEIAVVRADIRRLLNRERYILKKATKALRVGGGGEGPVLIKRHVGHIDAIATLEKYLAKIKNNNLA